MNKPNLLKSERCMELEQKVAELEKRVAALEGQVSEQPKQLVHSIKIADSNANDLIKNTVK